MKFLSMLAFVLLLQGSVSAADSAIVFRKIAYSEVFATAAKENKAVMLYFHFDGCGACAQMEKEVFTDAGTAKFFNDRFVCFSVNIYKGEGIETNKIYNVRLCPSFIFLDEKGNEIHKVVGSQKPEAFVAQGQVALDGSAGLTALHKRYKEGNRSPEFLYKYCYMLRDADHENARVLNEYIATQSLSDLGKENNLRFLYDFAVFKGGNIAFPVNSREYAFMKEHVELFKPYFEEEQVRSRLFFMANEKVYQAYNDSDEVAFDAALEELKLYDGKAYYYKNYKGLTIMWNEDIYVVLRYRLRFYDKTKNTTLYDKTLEEYIRKIWSDQEALNNMAWEFYEKKNEKKYLKQAVAWAKRSVELKSHYNNNDTYAALLYKTGDYHGAKKYAETAIAMAKEKKQDARATEALLQQINEKLK